MLLHWKDQLIRRFLHSKKWNELLKAAENVKKGSEELDRHLYKIVFLKKKKSDGQVAYVVSDGMMQCKIRQTSDTDSKIYIAKISMPNTPPLFRKFSCDAKRLFHQVSIFYHHYVAVPLKAIISSTKNTTKLCRNV